MLLSAGASIITWETPDRISTTGDTIVETDGTLIQAINFRHDQTGVIRTVNTVPFTTAVSVPSISATSASVASTVYQDGGVSAPFETMLDSFAFGGFVNSLTLSGLTAGNTYQVQLFSSDRRATTDNRYIEFDDGLGNSSDRVTQRRGYSTVGTFVADGTEQVIGIKGFTSATGSTGTGFSVSGFQVRETAVIPEPATAGLLLGSLMVLGLWGRRRRG
jgi:hypothetical protein